MASTSNAVTEIVSSGVAPPGVAPTVKGVERFGFHAQPTVLEIHFSEALDPTRVADWFNIKVFRYPLHARHGKKFGPPIKIKKTSYDAATMTVTLDMARRLSIHRKYELVVVGSAPNGLTDMTGQSLAGSNDVSGTNFTKILTGKDLAGPAPGFHALKKPTVRAKRSKPKSSREHSSSKPSAKAVGCAGILGSLGGEISHGQAWEGMNGVEDAMGKKAATSVDESCHAVSITILTSTKTKTDRLED